MSYHYIYNYFKNSNIKLKIKINRGLSNENLHFPHSYLVLDPNCVGRSHQKDSNNIHLPTKC